MKAREALAAYRQRGISGTALEDFKALSAEEQRELLFFAYMKTAHQIAILLTALEIPFEMGPPAEKPN